MACLPLITGVEVSLAGQPSISFRLGGLAGLADRLSGGRLQREAEARAMAAIGDPGKVVVL